MTVIMFKPEFVEKVRDGSKPHTIRPFRKGRQIEVGDKLSLRYWSGKPYRSKQVVIREVVCTRSSDVIIAKIKFVARGSEMRRLERDALAIADGFSSYDELLAWFEATHGLPFEGRLIEWGV